MKDALNRKADHEELQECKNHLTNTVQLNEFEYKCKRLDELETRIKDINNHNLNISTKIEEQAKKIDELVTRNEFLEEVAKKSDKQSMNNALNRKVNKSDLDMLLEKYADKSEIMQIKDN